MNSPKYASQISLECVERNNIFILGIAGRMKSGKDTAAEFLRRAFCHDSHVTWFAEPLKKMMIDYLGFTYDDLYTVTGKDRFNEFWGMTNREAMQRVGTECFRNNFHPNTWLKTLEVHLWKHPRRFYIVPDVRFNNEAELIHDLGGMVLEIKRPDLNTEGDEHKHASEAGVDLSLINHVIVNNSTKRDLYYATMRMLINTKLFNNGIQCSPILRGVADDEFTEDMYNVIGRCVQEGFASTAHDM